VLFGRIEIEEILTGIAIAVSVAVILWLGHCIRGRITRKRKEKKIYSWLKENSENKAGEQFKTTNEISQALGIDGDQIRKVCTVSKRIFQRSGKEDLWGIYSDKATSIYEERGPVVI